MLYRFYRFKFFKTKACALKKNINVYYWFSNNKMSSENKQVIKNVDMTEEMQQEALECANQALEKYSIEKDIAAHIKREFDKKHGTTWHCIVGRNFGSYVTHGKVKSFT